MVKEDDKDRLAAEASPDEELDLEWVREYTKMFQELANEFNLGTKITRIFDGGCGSGASTLAIARVFPGSQIEACSLGEEPNLEVQQELGKRLRFEKLGIKPYLIQSTAFDLILMAKIPHHNLNRQDDYDLLGRRVNQDRYVLTFGYELSLYFMGNDFRQIVIPNEVNELGFMSLWQKK